MKSSEESIALLNESYKKNGASAPGNISRIVSFGLNNSLVAIHLIGNGIILSSLGPTETAAASLITSIQSVVNGSLVGILLNTGVEIGNILGIKNIEKNGVQVEITEDERNKKIGDVIKLSWLVGGALGIVTTSMLLSTKLIMPKIVDSATGNEVGDFFLMFSIGSFSEPLGASNGMIIGRLEKSTITGILIPFLSMALYRLPALGLGYAFAYPLGMGVRGVGLGSAVAGLLSLFVTQLWFSRQSYQDYLLYNWHISDLKKRTLSYLNGGWKLSLQRLSEWGNVASISILVGIWSNVSLQSLLPAIQANSLGGITLQGMGQAAMMFIATDCKSQSELYADYQKTNSRDSLDKYSNIITQNRNTFLKYNLAGLILAGAVAAGIFFARRPVIKLFIPHASEDQYDQANIILILTLAGLFPDAIRIITGGVLRGWKDLLFPTIVSLFCMTLIGVSVGGGIGYAKDKDLLPIFDLRIATIALSALINCYRFISHLSHDRKLYAEGLKKLNSDIEIIESQNSQGLINSEENEYKTSSSSCSWMCFWRSSTKKNNLYQLPSQTPTNSSKLSLT